MKKKTEFSKLLAVWAAAVATLDLVATYLLAAFDKQPVSDLSVAVFTACVGYLVTYASKSAYEKGSRNRHGLDRDGRPHGRNNEKEEANVENQLETEAVE